MQEAPQAQDIDGDPAAAAPELAEEHGHVGQRAELSSDDDAPAPDDQDDDFVPDDGPESSESEEERKRSMEPSGSDDSDSGSDQAWGRRQKHSKKRRKKQRSPPPRPENHMTKKLRSAITPEELEQRRQAEKEAMRQQQRASRLAKQRAAARASAEPGGSGAAERASSAPTPTGQQDSGLEGGGDGDATERDNGKGDDDEEDDMDADEEPLQDREPEREVSEEQATADLAAVHAMWEFPTIVEFLYRFRASLGLQTEFTLESLACALVRSPGPGMLAQLHMDLLSGILSNPRTLSPKTWATNFGNRLRHEWQGLVGRPAPPFRPTKGMELHDYAALPATQRVLALKALCDIRLDREDVRAVVDSAVTGKPPPASGAAGPSKPPLPPGPAGRRGGAAATSQASTSSSRRGALQAASQQRGGAKVEPPAPLGPEDARKEALGVDSAGNTYWLFDCWDASREGAANYGIVLYREHPSSMPKPGSEGNGEEDGAGGAGTSKSGAGSKDAAAAAPKGKAAKGKRPKKLSAAELERQRLAAYVVPPQAVAGRWEKLAESLEELQECGTKLKRSLKKQDAELATKLLELVVPSIRERHDQEERWRKAREKTSKQLGIRWLELSGRSTRQRRPVNYNDEAYDKSIKEAIRLSNRERDEADVPAAKRLQVPPAPAATTARGELLRRQKNRQAVDSSGGEEKPAGKEQQQVSNRPRSSAEEDEVSEPDSSAPLPAPQQRKKAAAPPAPAAAAPEGSRRSTRPHQPKSYSLDDYDEQMREAIRAHEDEAPLPRVRQPRGKQQLGQQEEKQQSGQQEQDQQQQQQQIGQQGPEQQQAEQQPGEQQHEQLTGADGMQQEPAAGTAHEPGANAAEASGQCQRTGAGDMEGIELGGAAAAAASVLLPAAERQAAAAACGTEGAVSTLGVQGEEGPMANGPHEPCNGHAHAAPPCASEPAANGVAPEVLQQPSTCPESGLTSLSLETAV